MTPQALSVSEIKELCRLVDAVFAFLSQFRKEHELAKYIKAVQIPSELSESIAYHLIHQGKILSELNGYTLKRHRHNKAPDIVAIRDDNEVKIEVQATISTAYQRFGQKDIEADYLIWLHFDTFFNTADDIEVTLYIAPNQEGLFRANQQLQLKKFLAVATNVREYTFRLS